MRTRPNAGPDAVWPAQAQRALRGLIRAWHAARAQALAEIPADAPEPLIKEFRHAMLAGLSDVPRIPGPKHATAQHPGRDLLEFCRDRQDDVLRVLLRHRSLAHQQHRRERGLRPLKTQAEISVQLTSEQVTQDRLDIRNYLDTARKHGISVMTALRGAASGSPWRPLPH